MTVRAIGRTLDELMGVLAAGFVGFFVMLAYVVGSLIWFTCGVASFCFLLVALFSMVMWVFTHDKHAFHVMLGYFVYAGVAYAGIAAISHYQARLTKLVGNRRGRAARGRVGWRKTRQLGADSSPLRRSAQARNSVETEVLAAAGAAVMLAAMPPYAGSGTSRVQDTHRGRAIITENDSNMVSRATISPK